MEEEKRENAISNLQKDNLKLKADSTKNTIAWYFNPWAITFAILSVGPLGLLLLWFRPGTKLKIKIWVSIIVFLMSVWMTVVSVKYYQVMSNYCKEITENVKEL